MVDYRLVMRLVVEGKSYRFISSSTGVASATVSKASKAVRELGITTVAQLDQVSDDQIAVVVGDGRKSVSDHYVPIDLDQVLAQRTGRKKTALNVLWARYTDQVLPEGLKFYSYERFRQIVAGEVGARGLTARVIHSPGVSMQVDWAGTKMVLVDPIVGKQQKVSVFVACLPYSGMLFATACVNERQDNWHEAHRRAFEYFGGVTEVVVPDNAATATTVIAGSSGKRQINTAYEDFLAHYGTAAYATAPVSPKQKASVEAAVKVVTNWVIGALSDRQFTLLDDLNAAILTRVDAVNNRVPFRDQKISRKEIFQAEEHQFLSPLPDQPYVAVQWRKSKVAPNWHITVATCHYSVPYTLIGDTVDVRIRGEELAVMVDGEIVACHQVQHKRGGYSTDADRHGPPGFEIPGNLWTKDYFLTQARRVGPATRHAIEALFAATAITAQAYQPARNILGLGKGDNKPILEEACRRLTACTSARVVSYTAVKTMMAAIRAEEPLPTSRPTSPPDPRGQQPLTHPRRNGLVGGSEQFRLDKLTGQPTDSQQTPIQPADADSPETTAQDNQVQSSKSPDTQSPGRDATDSDTTTNSDDKQKAGE